MREKERERVREKEGERERESEGEAVRKYAAVGVQHKHTPNQPHL